MGLEFPRAEDKKDISQKKMSLLSAAAFAATLSGLVPNAAEAGGFAEQKVPEVARVEQDLHASGLPDVRLKFGKSIVPQITLFKGNREIDSKYGNPAETLKFFQNPRRVAFEVGYKNQYKKIMDDVSGTEVYINDYALAVMKHLGVRYLNGVISLQHGFPIDLHGEPGEENTKAELYGVFLEDRLIACVVEKKTEAPRAYSISVGGKGFSVEEQSIAEARRSCSGMSESEPKK